MTVSDLLRKTQEKSFKHLFKEEFPQRIVYERDYRRIGQKYLICMAKERGISEKEVEEILDDPQTLCDVAGHDLDSLFGAVITKNDKVHGEYVYSYEHAPKDKYFYWSHRSNDKIFEEIFRSDIEIDKVALLSATSNYIKNINIQDEWLDWYCADLICYNEYIETLKLVTVQNYGLIAYVMLGSKNWFIKILGYAVSIVFFLIKWGVWLFIIGMLINVGESETWANVAAGLFLLLTIFIKFNKWKARKRVEKLLNSMNNAYAVLATPTFSWEILWKALDESRQLGAVWPGELWRLVEVRRQKN
jgi:hypothetical protein